MPKQARGASRTQGQYNDLSAALRGPAVYGQQRAGVPAAYYGVSSLASPGAMAGAGLADGAAQGEHLGQQGHVCQSRHVASSHQQQQHQQQQQQHHHHHHHQQQQQQHHHQQQQQQQQDQTQQDALTALSLIPPPRPTRASSGAWSPAGDGALLDARLRGLNWAQIRDAHFPCKTANACRKRHERLMERKGADEWDARKLQRLAREYMAMRKEIWSGLAARTGEKWNIVEQKCMTNGLRNLQSAARAASRRDRLESGSHLAGYDDDSGVSGIALTPIDEADASYSSPEGFPPPPPPPPPLQPQHHHQQQQQFQAPPHACFNPSNSPPFTAPFTLAAQPFSYSSAVLPPARAAARRYPSATAAAAAAAAALNEGPYLHDERMHAVDMGIGSIINQPGRGLG
ncbi:hypothetical protein CDD81_8051 [Ophiocordyceps australis]|uniref:Myb-like domain-containing protein n=1 Tax=Ophiocordyceps australis TaxID=1399860 RepID=A0A2C5Y207_9HYPO|nr:hypothetical protein CDD81_8051 [Ophiocordyceps australis]